MTYNKLNLPSIVGILTIFFLVACTGANTETTKSDSASLPEIYHADNDIAMTVRSIVDAMRVGEKLDTADYNFEGILTDGEGRPLYTDIQGSPGEWTVEVLTPTSVAIRNVLLGDLLPEHLETYIAKSLDLTDDNIVASAEFDDDDEATLVVYDFGGGYLRFETRAAVAPNGLEGPFLSIVATKKAPL